jgi:hypothetical protein
VTQIRFGDDRLEQPLALQERDVEERLVVDLEDVDGHERGLRRVPRRDCTLLVSQRDGP